jgi:peptidoglycan hydrolase-like protein with peptidoglycan-binding domain
MRARSRVVVGAMSVVVVAAGAGVAIARPFGSAAATKNGSADNSAATSLATVEKRSLSAQTQVDATLGYAGSYAIVNQAHGTITVLPAVGEVVRQGQVLYEVDGAPVVLLYGSTPAYRALAQGASASDVKGPDVQALNASLVALGYATSATLDPASDEFGSQTKAAVKKLQAHLGVTENGVLALGQIVFVPTAARITSLPTGTALGASAAPGAPILNATSPDRLVTIDLDATQQSEVKAGDAVTITLPDQRTTPGVVWSVGTVATAPASNSPTGSTANPTITVEVVPTDPSAAGTLDQAPVSVSITTATVKNVLVVPVNALLALATGGYAVEEVAPDSVHHLVAAELGLFDDAEGLVEVRGSGLAVGQRVVVPAT